MCSLTMSRHAVHAGNLILVNGDHPYRGFCENLDLVPADDPTWTVASGPQLPGVCERLLARRAAAALDLLMRRIDGWPRIAAVSGWRPYQEQVNLWNESVDGNGLDFTRSYVAQPGCSEHHTGLAIDLGLLNGEPLDYIRPNFPYEGICQQFRELAPAFGFVERYPAGKEAVTGVAHEPWHFRYVGRPHAAVMAAKGLVLEEYLELLDRHPSSQEGLAWEDSDGTRWLLWRADAGSEDDPQAEVPVDRARLHAISGDNRGGFVVTERAG